MLVRPDNTLRTQPPLNLPAAYKRERRIAESLQRVLLRALPQETLPGLSVQAYYEAAFAEAAVGGDSFDVFPLADGRVALIVADASGKGLEAAERVAEVRYALRAFLREHRDPRRALSCLNDFVCDAQRLGQRDDGTFTTLTLAVLDRLTGGMTCLCAGGEPPLVLRTDGTVDAAPACGPALGVMPGQRYASASLHLWPGDTALLTTDGLTEARHQVRDDTVSFPGFCFLGLQGLARLAAQAQGGTPTGRPPTDELGRAIFEGARRFAGGTFHDDACLLLARRQ